MARLTEAALARLEEVRERAETLAKELSDPATFSDARRAAELSREHAELSGVVSRYEQYQTLLAQLDEAEALLRDGADDELKELARDELQALEPQVEEAIEGLQEFLRPRDPNADRDVILEIRG